MSPTAGPVYMRGHVRTVNKDHLIQLSHFQHGARLRRLKKALKDTFGGLPSSYDARTDGIIGVVKDQGNCGSCWDFSGTGVVEIAYNKAGLGGGKDTFVLSEEYTLSCGQNGGCNGDDNVTVLDWAKKTGLPLSSIYGPYQASPGRCKFVSGMQLFKIDDWGFCDHNGGNGVASVEDIKTAIIAYGCVGSAVAATSSWDGYQAGQVHTGHSQNIDHDVILTGWQDDASVQGGGWWWMRNSWSPGWGEGGYMRIAYGADSIGTEAVWAKVANPNPPTLDWSRYT